VSTITPSLKIGMTNVKSPLVEYGKADERKEGKKFIYDGENNMQEERGELKLSCPSPHPRNTSPNYGLILPRTLVLLMLDELSLPNQPQAL